MTYQFIHEVWIWTACQEICAHQSLLWKHMAPKGIPKRRVHSTHTGLQQNWYWRLKHDIKRHNIFFNRTQKALPFHPKLWPRAILATGRFLPSRLSMSLLRARECFKSRSLIKGHICIHHIAARPLLIHSFLWVWNSRAFAKFRDLLAFVEEESEYWLARCVSTNRYYMLAGPSP